jgi:enoyl-CoA hydratase/carnithine racemase
VGRAVDLALGLKAAWQLRCRSRKNMGEPMSADRVRVKIDAQGVAEVALTRSDKMNALDAAMFEALADTLARLAAEAELRAVVLYGEGRGFCAGLDMASFESMGKGTTADALRDLTSRTHGLCNLFQHVAWGWRELPVPVVAAVGADIRLVTADLRMSVMEIKWGLVPDMAGCVLMNQLAGTDIVRELTFTGRIFTGSEAVALGLATRVSADPLGEARTLACQIAQQNPDTIRANKRLLNLALSASPAEVLVAESVEQQRQIGSANQIESVRAAMEKRPPRFVSPARTT